MKSRHELEGDPRDVTMGPAADAPAYEPPAIEELGTLLQITAGTGARNRNDNGTTSV
jgi:hypothetical protein